MIVFMESRELISFVGWILKDWFKISFFLFSRNVSIFFLCQNIFGKERYHRIASLNSHFIILFRSSREHSQIEILARQMYGSSRAWELQQAYKMATAIPHNPLIIDWRPETDDKLRLRSNIIPPDTPIVYVNQHGQTNGKSRK